MMRPQSRAHDEGLLTKDLLCVSVLVSQEHQAPSQGSSATISHLTSSSNVPKPEHITRNTNDTEMKRRISPSAEDRPAKSSKRTPALTGLTKSKPSIPSVRRTPPSSSYLRTPAPDLESDEDEAIPLDLGNAPVGKPCSEGARPRSTMISDAVESTTPPGSPPRPRTADISPARAEEHITAPLINTIYNDSSPEPRFSPLILPTIPSAPTSAMLKQWAEEMAAIPEDMLPREEDEYSPSFDSPMSLCINPVSPTPSPALSL
jgi:hypothetical protein